MSLSDNYKPVKYIGNGVTKDFSFNFNMIDSAYCRVFLQDIETGEQTPKTIEVDYTLNFGDDGGQVSMKVAPTTEQYIVVYRDVSLDQKSDFRVGDTFSATKIEEEFDKQMAAIQQMEDGLNRSPKVPEGYNVNLTLPAPNAGKTLIWNEAENGFKNSTVNVDELEQATKQYLEESEAARDEAQGYASNASESASAAQASATNAANSASQAQSSEQAAQEAADMAKHASFGNIGDIKYTSRTDVPNGGAWCDGAEYTQAMFPDVYQMLVDGKLSSTDYTTFNNSVSTNGSCGLFAINTATTSFKVPLLTDVYLKAGQAPLMFGAESLPNIKGGFTAADKGATGAFSKTGAAGGFSGGNINWDNIDFNASRSSATYKDGAKVNPDHVVYRAYVVLYASAAEASVAQAAEFINAVNDVKDSLTTKANTDLSNITADAKDLIAGLGMPSDQYIDLDIQASGSKVTAPADGYYEIAVSGNKNGYVILACLDENDNSIYGAQSPVLSGSGATIMLPITKGKICRYEYNTSVYVWRFIYAEGSKE